MKICTTLFCSMLVILCLAAGQGSAQTPAAQPAAGQNQNRPVNYLVVNYMKVKGDIEGMQRELWVPVHKESVKQGRMAGWSSWRVRWAGTGSEYDFVTVDAFKNWADLERSPATAETWAKVHPGVKMEDVNKRTAAARDIVRRDVLTLIAETENAAGAAPVKYVIVDYMKAAPGKGQEYVSLERDTYLPMHQELVKQGRMTFWQFFRVRGTGSVNSYDYLTVRGYSNWEDVRALGSQSVLAKVHPNLKPEDLNARIGAARTMARSETLTLVEQIR